MFGCGHKRNAEFTSQYATSADHTWIFQQDMSSLYLLSFLLTGNHARAEQCYLGAIESAIKGNPVFKEWAGSWSRRCVIRSAIRLGFSQSIHNEVRDVWDESAVSSVIHVVTRLAPLERFVFVMSVLERYSAPECSVLLNCTAQDVIAIRLQALRALGEFDPALTVESRLMYSDV
jgi:hypothetical protein